MKWSNLFIPIVSTNPHEHTFCKPVTNDLVEAWFLGSRDPCPRTGSIPRKHVLQKEEFFTWSSITWSCLQTCCNSSISP
ncbi:hypothetical protein Gasu2_57580 [Galdieria sulphuraria]|nr:hypothetical protein Gasu2_57580 [Galdieria sulphuraria]